MAQNKIFTLAGALAVLAIAIVPGTALAASPTVAITPASGTYTASDSFAVTATLNADGCTAPSDVKWTLDSETPVTSGLSESFDLSAVGTHTIKAEATFSGGSGCKKTHIINTYTIVAGAPVGELYVAPASVQEAANNPAVQLVAKRNDSYGNPVVVTASWDDDCFAGVGSLTDVSDSGLLTIGEYTEICSVTASEGGDNVVVPVMITGDSPPPVPQLPTLVLTLAGLGLIGVIGAVGYGRRK